GPTLPWASTLGDPQSKRASSTPATTVSLGNGSPPPLPNQQPQKPLRAPLRPSQRRYSPKRLARSVPRLLPSADFRTCGSAQAFPAWSVDVGGASIKAGFVATRNPCVVGERFPAPPPQPATPEAVAGAVATLATQVLAQEVGTERTATSSLGGFQNLRIGVAIPSVVARQEARTAANIAHSWIGTRPAAVFDNALRKALPHGNSDRCALQVAWFFLNDADAAGISECGPGAAGEAADPEYSRLFLTFGTGIGSALFRGSRLYPNTELGHLTVLTDDGSPSSAEHWASAAVKARQNLTFPEWAARVSTVLNTY